MTTPIESQELIIQAVSERFRCFGGGKKSIWGNPIAEALKDKPPMFAAGVDVAEVVAFVLQVRDQITPELP